MIGMLFVHLNKTKYYDTVHCSVNIMYANLRKSGNNCLCMGYSQSVIFLQMGRFLKQTTEILEGEDYTFLSSCFRIMKYYSIILLYIVKEL